MYRLFIYKYTNILSFFFFFFLAVSIFCFWEEAEGEWKAGVVMWKR